MHRMSRSGVASSAYRRRCRTCVAQDGNGSDHHGRPAAHTSVPQMAAWGTAHGSQQSRTLEDAPVKSIVNLENYFPDQGRQPVLSLKTNLT